MNQIRLLFFGLVFMLLAVSAKGIGPENVAVVVNADSWSSKAVANEFIRLRAIPPQNVVFLEGIGTFDRMGIEEFRTKILSPVLKILDERGVSAQIDCITYSSDFPTSIDASADTQGKTLPPVLSPIGSINSFTYLYQFVVSKNLSYLDFNSNLYARRVLRRSSDTQWSNEERTEYAKTFELMRQEPKNDAPKDDAVNEQAMKKFDEAVVIFKKLAVAHPNSEELLYNMACCQARLGKTAEALGSLQKSFANGWANWSHTQMDEDLKSLRETPEFKEIIGKMKTTKVEMGPAAGFKSNVAWAADGSPVQIGKGISYLLSTMLACTSGRGMSVGESLECLRAAAKADYTRPKGTIYFEKNGDVRSTTREWAFFSAVEKLKSLGVNAVLEDGVLPQNRQDVAGAVVGSAGFEWKKSGSKILPGALCEHLTSCGGMMGEGDGQTCLTEFLVNGAAGASGAVTEPYAIQAKFPTPFVQGYYVEGASLVEAFYQSLTGPYQLLIIGDPLCKPWGKKIDVGIMGMNPGEKLSGIADISPIAKCPQGLEIIQNQLFIDGKRLMMAKGKEGFKLDTTKIPDGYHSLQIVSLANDQVINQGTVSLPVEIRNGKRTMKAALVGESAHAWNRPVEINLESAGAKEIALMCNSVAVAKVEGGKGKVSIDPRLLGTGPVSLKPVAFFASETDKELYGKQIDLQIIPPPASDALDAKKTGELKDGLLVRPKDKPLAIIEKLDGASIEKAGVVNGSDFTVEGYFTADKDDVYQFQINLSATKIKSLNVDGKKIEWSSRDGATWWMVPVNLRAGLHKVAIDCTAVSTGGIDIRFGGPGSQRLNGQKFKHLGSDDPIK